MSWGSRASLPPRIVELHCLPLPTSRHQVPAKGLWRGQAGPGAGWDQLPRKSVPVTRPKPRCRSQTLKLKARSLTTGTQCPENPAQGAARPADRSPSRPGPGASWLCFPERRLVTRTKALKLSVLFVHPLQGSGICGPRSKPSPCLVSCGSGAKSVFYIWNGLGKRIKISCMKILRGQT